MTLCSNYLIGARHQRLVLKIDETGALRRLRNQCQEPFKLEIAAGGDVSKTRRDLDVGNHALPGQMALRLQKDFRGQVRTEAESRRHLGVDFAGRTDGLTRFRTDDCREPIVFRSQRTRRPRRKCLRRYEQVDGRLNRKASGPGTTRSEFGSMPERKIVLS